LEDEEQNVPLGDYQLFETKYSLLEKLGEGSNGVVRRCKKKETGELFAVKSFTLED
jgi:serine/threonine protein kinase